MGRIRPFIINQPILQLNIKICTIEAQYIFIKEYFIFKYKF